MILTDARVCVRDRERERWESIGQQYIIISENYVDQIENFIDDLLLRNS